MSPLDSVTPLRAVGKSVPRVDGRLKVGGKAHFAAEIKLPGMVYAALAYSEIAQGNITAIDTSQAEAAPGVVFVMTYRNAPKMPAPPLFGTSEGAVGASTLPVMQNDKINWNGEPIAIVLAETTEQAEHAATLIRATYKEHGAVTAFAEAKKHARTPDAIMGDKSKLEIGHAERALKSAPVSVDNIYTTPRHNHCAIELHAVTVVWEDGKLTVHDATQMLNGTRSTLAKIFSVKEDDIRVMSPFVGGGFGNKGLWSHHILAIAAAREARRPVRLMLSREGVFRATGGRTLTEQRVALGAKPDGTLAALIHTGIAGMTSHNNVPEQFTFPARHLYAAENMLIGQEVADLNMVANTFMRAPGESIGTFALESALDELAHALKLDPIELRRRLEPAKDPVSGKEFSSRHLLEAYQRGAERFGWNRRNPEPGAVRDGEWRIGMGVATATYPYYRMPGGSARVALSASGHATVQMASHEMGMGTATVQAQYAAERLGLPLDHVRFEYGDTHLPKGTIAGGSSQTATIIDCVDAALTALIPELLHAAGNDSPLAGLRPQDVEFHGGALCARNDRTRCESYTSILSRAGRSEIAAEAKGTKPEEQQNYSMHSYGAQFCEVRVSSITGEVRVNRFLGSFDTGRILNPRTAASQFRGGIVMGLGLALTEETQFDERTGRIMNPSLAEYHVPVHMDVPPIEVMWTDIPDPKSAYGVHGIGEIGITGVGAAVANAVFNATGVRLRDLPITPDKLL